MFTALKNIFSSAPKVDLGELIANKAIILDVRTKKEYQGGHIKGSINIPLQSLNTQLQKLKKEKTFITCCASGGRSSIARNILKSNGFENVHNAGSWTNLRQYQ
jgi:rhodanese-related sulfurtransferase